MTTTPSTTISTTTKTKAWSVLSTSKARITQTTFTTKTTTINSTESKTLTDNDQFKSSMSEDTTNVNKWARVREDDLNELIKLTTSPQLFTPTPSIISSYTEPQLITNHSTTNPDNIKVIFSNKSFTNRTYKSRSTTTSSILEITLDQTTVLRSDDDNESVWRSKYSTISNEPKLKLLHVLEATSSSIDNTQPIFFGDYNDNDDFERPIKTTKQFRPISSIVFAEVANSTFSQSLEVQSTSVAPVATNSTSLSKLIVDRPSNSIAFSNINNLKSKFKSYKGKINSVASSNSRVRKSR